MDLDVPFEAQRPAVRVGIAGLGRAAFFTHLPAFRALPDLYRLVAVCDLLKERRDIVEKEFPDIRTYRRIEDMLDDPEIDVILVTLPTADHVSCALECLRRERWTVVEAPLATTHEDAKILQGASVKARGKLFAYTPGLFSPDFRLAQSMLDDARLGDVFEVRVCRQDYLRRDDWQSVKRCLGGCAWYEGQDALLQAVTLMRAQPAQLWSELKRVAALGDAEDFAHIVLKSRGAVSADIEICGGRLPPFDPLFTVRGSRGAFSVAADATEGNLHVIDPDFKLPRRRSSVRTPPLEDLHEQLPVVDIPVTAPGDHEPAPIAFWRALYTTIRTAAPFPVALDDVVETIRYLQLVKRASPFAI
ncbi:MAG: Gfo/Idh/MocA family protein [Kiritimatiellia bacterium]